MFIIKLALSIVEHPEVFLTGLALGYLTPGSIPAIITAASPVASKLLAAARSAASSLLSKVKKLF